MNNLHRIFIAINLPEKLKKELSLFQNRWPEIPARWTRPDNLHVTLVFWAMSPIRKLAIFVLWRPKLAAVTVHLTLRSITFFTDLPEKYLLV